MDEIRTARRYEVNNLLPAELISKLSGKFWKAKKRVDGSVAGRHTSRSQGHSLDFAQHRQYAPGDEIKHIDWKLFGRNEKFFIKQFQAETNLRAYIVLDASNSMAYGSKGRISKFEYARCIAAAISYIFIKQTDAVGLAIMKNGLAEFLPPKIGWEHFRVITGMLEKTVASGICRLADGITELAKRIKRRSLVIVISDLLENQKEVIKSLKYLNSQHHDCTVLQILDDSEVRLPYDYECEFIDLETRSTAGGFWNLAKEYDRKMEVFLSSYKISFRKSGVEYHLVTTEKPPEHLIADIIE